MGKYIVNCPQCNQSLETQDEWANMQTQCPACNANFTIPPRKIKPQPPVCPTPVPQNQPSAQQNFQKEIIVPQQNKEKMLFNHQQKESVGKYIVNCPQCNQSMEAQDEWANMQTQCPACNANFTIPPRKIKPQPPVCPPPIQQNQPSAQQNFHQKIIVPHQGTQNAAATLPASAELSLYSPKAAANWSVLFTPGFGSWCLWQNYKAIGNEKLAQRSLIWMIASIILEIIFAFCFRGGGIALLITWYCAELRPHEKYLQNNNITYTKKSWTTPVLIAFGILALWIVFAMMVIGASL